MTALRRRRSSSLLVMLVVAVLGGLAGCAQIPRTGPVVAGGAGDPDPREGIYQVIAEGPQPGDAPVALVRGFIRASAGFGNDHQVARSFITDESRLTWRPDAQVSVFPSEKDLAVTSEADGSEATVTVKVPVTIGIDGDGRYEIQDPGTRRTEKFTVRFADGRWRIDTLEDGILIVASDFDATFRPFPVYFPDPTGSYLIPDVHWFAGARDLPESPEIPTALVRVMLQGPPKWLKGAVTTGAPAGTAMALGAVVVSDEVATVDLTSQALKTSTRQRQMLAGQLRATLGQLGNIDSVRLTVRQVELDSAPEEEPDKNLATGASGIQLRVDPQVGDQALVIEKGRLGWLSGRTVALIDGLDGLRVPGVNASAVSADRVTYAALDADRGKLLMQTKGAKDAVTVARGAQLSPPSFDPQGWVWTSPAVSNGTVHAVRTGAVEAKVSAAWLRGKRLISLRMSRDGARALVAVDVKGQAHVFVAGVMRDPDGRPTELTQPDGLIPDLQTVDDASWVDEDQVAVLGTRSGSKQQVWLAQLGGPVTGRGGVDGAQTVTAGDGEGSLSIGSAAGTYSYLQGWQKASGARWPTYPG